VRGGASGALPRGWGSPEEALAGRRGERRRKGEEVPGGWRGQGVQGRLWGTWRGRGRGGGLADWGVWVACWQEVVVVVLSWKSTALFRGT
jgi:hypothetical protein